MTLETQPIIGAMKRVSSRAHENLTIFAPYVTARALIRVLAGSPAQTIDVVTTWQTADIALGISDTAIYELLVSVGGTLRLLPGLHMKAVIADFSEMFIGSGNITSSGIGIGPKSNIECGVVCRVSEDDAAWFRSLLAQSQIVTQAAYNAFLRHLQAYQGPAMPLRSQEFDWSQWDIRQKQEAYIPDFPDPDAFIQVWTKLTDLKGSEDLDKRFRHDLMLLGLPEIPPPDVHAARQAVLDAYVGLPVIQDFLCFVASERFFGAMRRWIRQRLPCEQDAEYVNDATRRLLTWTTKLCPHYHLDRPNYSYRLVCRTKAQNCSATIRAAERSGSITA